MRRLGPLLLLGVIALVAWTYLGGSLRAENPDKPKLPTANQAADAATDAANRGADGVMSLSPSSWRVIIILVLAGAAIWLWARFPALKWLLIGGGITAVVIVSGVMK